MSLARSLGEPPASFAENRSARNLATSKVAQSQLGAQSIPTNLTGPIGHRDTSHNKVNSDRKF